MKTDNELIGREQARSLGLMHYFTGKPCRRGHIAQRLVSCGKCTVCIKNAVTRQILKNPAKFREDARRRAQTWVDGNRPKEQKRQRLAKRKKYEADRETILQRNRGWAARNKDKVLARNRRRRAIAKGLSSTLTSAQWQELLRSTKRCHWCKRPFNTKRKPTHDHVVPIAKGGANTLENSVAACAGCNTSKRDSLINPYTGQGILL